MRGTIRAAVVIAVLALGMLAGCGDDQVKADNAYVAATDRAVRRFETQFQALQARFTPVSTPAQDLRTLATLRGAVDRVQAQLVRVRAPARIADLHARLIGELQGYRGVIRAARQGLGARDPKGADTARARFSTRLAAVATRVTATINAINRRLR